MKLKINEYYLLTWNKNMDNKAICRLLDIDNGVCRFKIVYDYLMNEKNKVYKVNPSNSITIIEYIGNKEKVFVELL